MDGERGLLDQLSRIAPRKGERAVDSWLRLIHYWWPVALGWSIALVVARATGHSPSRAGLTVLLCGIWGLYSLDRWLEVEAPGWLRKVLAAGFVAASAGALWWLRRLPTGTEALVGILAATGFAYRRLKQLPLVKSVLVPAVWVWAGIALSLADGSWFGWRAAQLPVALPLFALFAAGCLLCDIKDAETDRRAGVGSLPALLGTGWTLAVASGLSVLAALIAYEQWRPGLLIGSLALLALGACRPLLEQGPVGALAVDLVLTLPGLLIAARLV